MFPEIIETDKLTKEIVLNDGIVYKYNFDNQSYETLDGNLIEIVNKSEKIKQWLEFLIRTEFESIDIYKSTEFGLSLKKYIGKKNIPLGLISSEIKEQLNKKIFLNSDIKEISKVIVSKSSSKELVINIFVMSAVEGELEVSINV
ncbi:DUF2634 domain-containing protein [Helicovermis profundi]|uniref:DUF2634 domain-containing protein n=1 Tax=Helicovermis profundi TaxID=3065157 RepID=A0AAU9ENE4_9FIRM|nr:hypothetical protein HLPR_11520 [Clostridia bacterium S502]